MGFYGIVDGIGAEGYDAGAKTLEEFYAHDLDPLGKSIIDLCQNGGDVDAYRSRLALYPRGTKKSPHFTHAAGKVSPNPAYS